MKLRKAIIGMMMLLLGVSTVLVGQESAKAFYHFGYANVNITNISSNKITLIQGETFQLKYSLYDIPELKGVDATFGYGDVNVATVTKKGLIKAIAPGKTRIGIIRGLVTEYLHVTVVAPKNLVEIKASNQSASIGVKQKIKYSIKTYFGATKAVSFSSSNTKIATISSKGTITPKKKGTCYLTIKSKYKEKTYQKKIKLTVKGGKVKITPTKKSLTIYTGSATTLKYKISATKGVTKGVTFTSSNPNVANVTSKGVVNAFTKGKTTISIKSKYNPYVIGKVTVTVKENGSGWRNDIANKAINLMKKKYYWVNNKDRPFVVEQYSAYDPLVADWAKGKITSKQLITKIKKGVLIDKGVFSSKNCYVTSFIVKGYNATTIHNEALKRMDVQIRLMEVYNMKVYYNKKTNTSTVYISCSEYPD